MNQFCYFTGRGCLGLFQDAEILIVAIFRPLFYHTFVWEITNVFEISSYTISRMGLAGLSLSGQNKPLNASSNTCQSIRPAKNVKGMFAAQLFPKCAVSIHLWFIYGFRKYVKSARFWDGNTLSLHICTQQSCYKTLTHVRLNNF